ncbi:MAG: M1 family metallopeptidase, partial [Ferruginibacter sp.]|nr:M1 family metallopeptidase [Ferruginibacter sp.]
QQRVKYTMNIDMDVSQNRFIGKQKLEYSNNSEDKLERIFYHLYWNAFQPNSSMDNRSRELGKKIINGNQDWDSRVTNRIFSLNNDEIGYQKIISLKMNGVSQPFKYHETILEVNLTKPIMPNSKVILEMEFEAQVPLQIRRSGRDNPYTGVRLSMSQWYPKICEYDYEGWHADAYVAREFYGVWGDYDVSISIDKTYKIGATGVLLNASQIGWGYDKPNTELKPISSEKRVWQFKGDNIHDFVWAADPDYMHIVKKIKNGPDIHVIYNNETLDEITNQEWRTIADAAADALPFIEKKFGKYPYPQYSFIHGGDGGMEYPMATLMASPSLGTAFHEWMHSWYQMMLGTNESQYAWMDEGFTSFAEELVSDYYKRLKEKIPESSSLDALKKPNSLGFPLFHYGAYMNYFALVKSGQEEPMSTFADHYSSNFAYSIDAYSKGQIFLEQLGYITGADIRDKILLEYYEKWRFKHPNPNDFFRIAEAVSGMELKWYKMYWTQTTKTIDYGIDSLWEENGLSKIRLKRIGQMPMPIDFQLVFKDGHSEIHSIPLDLMYGAKRPEISGLNWITENEWKWTSTTYSISVKGRLKDIVRLEIDPTKRMADVDRKNNLLELKW